MYVKAVCASYVLEQTDNTEIPLSESYYYVWVIMFSLHQFDRLSMFWNSAKKTGFIYSLL